MATLPVVDVGAVPPLPVRSHPGRQWTVAALSLTAAVALGMVMIPKKGTPPVQRIAPAPETVAPPVVAAPAAMAPHRPVRHVPARPVVQQADFVRLDDEPLETATIVRVSAENGDVQADLLMGPDGRAHAIRVIGK